MSEIIYNTGIVCTGGNVNIGSCVVGDGATIIVGGTPVDDDDNDDD
jgi:hypothetical protein